MRNLATGRTAKLLKKAGKYTYECWKRFGPIRITGVSIKQFSVGANHTAAIDVLGKLYTWGFVIGQARVRPQ